MEVFKPQKREYTDYEGYRHEAVLDGRGKPISDKKFDENGNLIGEGVYENGEYVGRMEYFYDADHERHVARYDDRNRPVSDKIYDDKGKLVSEGIYKDGEFVGHKEYSTDKDGYHHETTFNDRGFSVSDKKFDDQGNLVGEAEVLREKDGTVKGTKRRFMDDQKNWHEAEFDANGNCISDKKLPPKKNVMDKYVSTPRNVRGGKEM